LAAHSAVGYPAFFRHPSRPITPLAILTFFLDVFALEVINSSMIQISENLRIFQKLALTRESLAHRHGAEPQHPKLRKENFSIASL